MKEISDHLASIDKEHLTKVEMRFQNGEITISELIENAFKRFFQSYAQSINKVYNRKGNLFYKPFKRIKIDRDTHFTQAIIYTNANAVKHGLVKKLDEWKWSSWHSYLSNQPTKLKKSEVLEWFGGLQEFIRTHYEMTDYYYGDDVSIED